MTAPLALRIAVFGLLLAGLSGCGFFGFRGGEPREAWRAQASAACMRSGLVKPTAFVRPRGSVDGPGICGADRAFTMTAATGGRVGFSEPAILDCPMIVATERWFVQAVQPASYAYFGQPVVAVGIAGSYVCRGRNGASKGPLSEHAFANALDVSSFTLADGRRITVEAGWWGAADEGRFLRAVQRGACDRFTTVIGPEGDSAHRDHLHLDLARHVRKNTYRYCR
jgi:hypothetical protein